MILSSLPTLPDWLLPVAAAPFIGSLMGVMIRRLHDGRRIGLARSACDACGRSLRPQDLVPLLSFVGLRGRSACCAQKISWFYPIVELAALAVAGWACLATDAPWPGCVFGWTLLTLAWIDLRSMLLPDALTLPLLAAGLGLAALAGRDLLADRAAAAALGFGLFESLALIYRRLRGREGLGMGDSKLLAALGAWLGLAALPLVMLLAACIGLAAVGGATLAGRRLAHDTAIPFGPCLAASGWLIWLYGDEWLMWLGLG